MKPQFRFLINLLFFFFLMVLALGLLGYPTPLSQFITMLCPVAFHGDMVHSLILSAVYLDELLYEMLKC